MSTLNSGVSVSDLPTILSSGITKIKENSPQQLQPKMNSSGKFASQPNQPASSLDYLYQAISLIETKNNQANAYYLNQGISNNITNHNVNKPCTGINNVANAHQNINKQQNLMVNNLNNNDQKRYCGQFISPTEQFNQFYNLNGQHNLNQSQFSIVDSRRYLNNLMLQQQQLQKSQQHQQQQQQNQQQQQQAQMKCRDPYCNCNETILNKTLNSNKINTINNIIGQQQQHQPIQLSSISSSNNLNHKLTKSPPRKILKQRRNEERSTERRISNLIQLSKSQLSTLQNKKNISKHLQVNNMKNNEFSVHSEKNFSNKKTTPSRLEKAKQLARKQQNTLKLNLATTDAQMIDHEGLLTPLSAASSISPASITAHSPLSSISPLTPQFSPKVPQLPQTPQNNNNNNSLLQNNKFNFYPVEIMNTLIPLYLTPYLNNMNQSNGSNLNQNSAPITLSPNGNQYQLPTQIPTPTNGPANSIDQLYFQNLVTAIYTIANYQQQQQQNIQNNNHTIIPNMPVNSNNNNCKPCYSMNENTNSSSCNSSNLQKLNQNPVQLLLKQTYLNAQNSAGLSEKVDKSKSSPLTPIANQKKTETKYDNSKNLKRKSTSKIISYIGNDIDGKVHEHFRRSLGTKYLKILNKLNNKITSSNISESSVSDSGPEKLNGLDEITTNCAEEKNIEKEPWITDVNNNNDEEFCECSNFECQQNHTTYPKCENKSSNNSLDNSDVDSDTYDELNGYDTEENLIDSLNVDTIPSNPSTPASHASYSYSVTSQNSNLPNEECNENDNDINDFDDMIDSIESDSLPNIIVPSSQLIS